MAVSLDNMIWVSGNKKWAIHSIEKEGIFDILWVIDLVKGRGFNVVVEHVKKGDKLLYGGYAEKDYDSFDSDRPIPKYLEKKILELI